MPFPRTEATKELERHKEKFYEWYNVQGLSLPDIVVKFREELGIEVTVERLASRRRQWGFERKRIPTNAKPDGLGEDEPQIHKPAAEGIDNPVKRKAHENPRLTNMNIPSTESAAIVIDRRDVDSPVCLDYRIDDTDWGLSGLLETSNDQDELYPYPDWLPGPLSLSSSYCLTPVQESFSLIDGLGRSRAGTTAEDTSGIPPSFFGETLQPLEGLTVTPSRLHEAKDGLIVGPTIMHPGLPDRSRSRTRKRSPLGSFTDPVRSKTPRSR
ncbi:hypothetical protein MMC08_005013 [Hypocenomyce scalaris]|nr:hypothetical protein [Hypocenomyce scalaris]